MTDPIKPAGVLDVTPRRAGSVAQWRNAGRLPYLEVILWEAPAPGQLSLDTDDIPARAVTIKTGPASYPAQVTDPSELEAMVSMLMTARSWLQADDG